MKEEAKYIIVFVFGGAAGGLVLANHFLYAFISFLIAMAFLTWAFHGPEHGE